VCKLSKQIIARRGNHPGTPLRFISQDLTFHPHDPPCSSMALCFFKDPQQFKAHEGVFTHLRSCRICACFGKKSLEGSPNTRCVNCSTAGLWVERHEHKYTQTHAQTHTQNESQAAKKLSEHNTSQNAGATMPIDCHSCCHEERKKKP
jgi:hypothetical protein